MIWTSDMEPVVVDDTTVSAAVPRPCGRIPTASPSSTARAARR